MEDKTQTKEIMEKVQTENLTEDQTKELRFFVKEMCGKKYMTDTIHNEARSLKILMKDYLKTNLLDSDQDRQEEITQEIMDSDLTSATKRNLLRTLRRYCEYRDIDFQLDMSKIMDRSIALPSQEIYTFDWKGKWHDTTMLEDIFRENFAHIQSGGVADFHVHTNSGRLSVYTSRIVDSMEGSIVIVADKYTHAIDDLRFHPDFPIENCRKVRKVPQWLEKRFKEHQKYRVNPQVTSNEMP